MYFIHCVNSQNYVYVINILYPQIKVQVQEKIFLESTVLPLMSLWEETSYQLERRQTNVECALQEFSGLQDRTAPCYKLTFNPDVRSTAIYKHLSC